MKKASPEDKMMSPATEMVQDFLSHARTLNYSKTTLNAYRINIGRFVKWLEDANGIQSPEAITKDHLYDWMQYLAAHRTRRGLPLRPSSINKNIENTRKFIAWIIAKGYLRQNILDALEYVKAPDLLPTSVLTHAQVKKLVSRIKTDTPFGYRDRAMIEMLYSTGIRAGELLGLDVGHVDFANKTVLVTGKGNKERMTPVGRTALRYLETYIKAVRPFLVRDASENALFLNRDGRRMTYERLLHAVRIHTRAAKLDVNVTPHTFRRSCTTELLRGGANMYHVKELLGHKSLNTLRHYAKLTISDLKKTHTKCHPRERESD
jgi:integrase/recombinase XerD